MALSLVTREEALRRVAERAGGAHDSAEALSDLLRAEVHARKHAPRAATLSRVARLLAPVAVVDEERLEDACDALEREGDIVLAPGGILYATPTRVVPLEKTARVFSSVPTRVLVAVFGREVSARGSARSTSAEGLAEALERVSGVTVTPEAWAGIDRTPVADAAFLANLDQRLEWQAFGAGSLEKDGPLDWRTWQATAEGARWSRSHEGRLWWARTRFGGHHRAWTASAAPSTSPFIELSSDDADRARFALSRAMDGASMLRIERSGQRVTIEVPGWLPRSEYRWLSLRAVPATNAKGTRWELDANDEALITKFLSERLGLVVEVR